MNIESRYRKVTGKVKGPWTDWQPLGGTITEKVAGVLERYNELGYGGAVVKIRTAVHDEQFREAKP